MLVFFARGWQLGAGLVYSTRDKIPEGREEDARATGHLQPWVTVLVACRNETHRMTPLLKALVEQEVSFGWELLWIDDFSDDDSVAMVKSFLAN
ncbi:MAG: hypothetical protein ACO3GL_06005, partial [Bacteroidia bacterium]